MKTFSVKNFERFQHYKDRAPPWIKLYNELLDDYSFGALPDASKMHLIAIWLLASRSENKIPFDPKWVARRINANSTVDLELLADHGFIVIDQSLQIAEQDASKTIAKCLSRERVEGETEKRREESIQTLSKAEMSEAFPRFKKAYPKREGANPWQPAEKKFKALVKTGVDPETMIQAASELAREEGARGNIGTKFIPQAITWLNQQRFQDYAAASFDADKPFDWDTVFTTYKKLHHWSKHAGPSPDSPGCRAPKEILEKYGFVQAESFEQPPAPILRSMQ